LNGQVQAGSEEARHRDPQRHDVPFDDPGLPTRLAPEEPEHLELVGSACTTLKSTPNATLSARFPAAVVQPNSQVIVAR